MARIHHMVLLKFKPAVSEEEIARVFADLAELRKQIPGITDFAGGPYSSPEGLNGGFTHGFLMTFDSPQSRDIYLPHPEHERVKNAILPRIDGVVAFDFEAP